MPIKDKKHITQSKPTHKANLLKNKPSKKKKIITPKTTKKKTVNSLRKKNASVAKKNK